MAHFIRPQGPPPADYDVDGRLAPDSVWRVRIPVGATTRQVGLWSGRNF